MSNRFYLQYDDKYSLIAVCSAHLVFLKVVGGY